MKNKTTFNDNKTVIRYFINLVHSLTPSYMPTLALQSLITTLRPLIFIVGPKLIVDELMGSGSTNQLILIISGIAISNFILNMLEKLLRNRCNLLTEQFNNAFGRYISKVTTEIDFENIEDPDILDLKERAMFAITNHGLIFAMINAMTKVVNEVFLVIGLSALIWTFSPLVFLLLFVVVALNSVIFKKVQKYYYRESVDSVKGNRSYVYYINQSSDLEIAKDLRLYGMSPMILDKMNQFSLMTYKIYSELYGAISRLNGLTSVNVQIQTVIIYLILAVKTRAGEVTLGNFMMYAGAVAKFSSSMNQFVSGVIEVNRICRQLDLLVEYEKIPASKDIGDCEIPESESYELEFHDVSFKYPRATEYTLKHISVKISAGEKISIIGLNGAGKTTFVKLLTRLYMPTEGYITLNGIDIKTLKYDAYMSKIAAVFQDYRLLGLTVAENVTGTSSEDALVDESEISEILKEVGVLDAVQSLKHGINTPLDKGFDKEATKLSGGQAQKLAIARALYKNAPIVVLDEPTAALDPLAEHEIYCRFDELVKGKTAIYISHRLSSCRFCDRVLVFHEGSIIQVGSHDALIAQKGYQYEVMFNAQAAYYVAG